MLHPYLAKLNGFLLQKSSVTPKSDVNGAVTSISDISHIYDET